MKKSKNVPEIRFEGFTEDWEQRKFRDIIVQLTGGASISPADYQEEGVRTIPKGAVNSTGVADLSGSKNVTKQFFERNISSVVSANSLVTSLRDLVPSAPNMGRIVRIEGVNEDFLMPQGVYRIQLTDSTDENFVIAYSNSEQYRKIISSEKNGSTQVHIRNGEFLNIDIPTPSYEEQIKCGILFKHLDNLITLHQRKCDKLLDLKNSMLYKLFPKEGDNKPELRFQGFTDEWTKKKLGDCFSERTESFPDGELLSVTINDGIKKFSELNRNDNSNENKSKYKKVYVGDIAYNSMRMWQGASGYSPYEGIVSPAYTVLQPNEGIDSKCFSYLFKRPDVVHMFQLYSKGITSDNWNLKYPEFKELEIYVSENYEEQKLIGQYLSKLDSIIDLNNEKLKKLEHIKSYLLDKMFV